MTSLLLSTEDSISQNNANQNKTSTTAIVSRYIMTNIGLLMTALLLSTEDNKARIIQVYWR